MTKTFILFPEGYDPMVAEGPPDEDCVKMGITWTPEETEACRNMRFNVEEITCEAEVDPFNKDDFHMKNPIVRRWIVQISKEEYLRTLPKQELNFII